MRIPGIATRVTAALCTVGGTAFLGMQSPPALAFEDDSALQEVIVTANRREENVQKVPVSIQVITGGDLDKSGASQFQDYLNSVSSVGFTKSGAGSVRLGIRGVSNVNGDESGVAKSKSAVGLYLNDVPIQGAGPIPDLSLYDLSRVEVLKGPQGTLYGEGSMGGAIKMILTPADPTAFSAKGDISASDGSRTDTNYNIRGAVNIPLIADRLAARIVATYRDDQGYIDNIRTGQDGLGDNELSSARLLLDGKITDSLSAELLYLHQHQKIDGFPDVSVTNVDAAPTDVKTSIDDLTTDIPDRRYMRQDFDLAGITLKYRVGSVELSAASSYWQNKRDRYDRNPFIGIYDGFALLDFGLPGIDISDPQGFTINVDQHAYAQELRLSSVDADRFNWTVGAFMRSAKQKGRSWDTLPNFAVYNANMQANAAAMAPLLGFLGATLDDALFDDERDVYRNVVHESFKQYAVYGETDIKLNEKLSLKLGLRAFKEDLDIDQSAEALAIEALDFMLAGFPVTSQSSASADDDGVVPRVGLAYQVTPDHLLYALASKGFRSGGPNFNDFHDPTVPELYKADTLWNYELGAKTMWLDRRLAVNLSLYRVDWKDVQVPAVSPGSTGYVANGGKARINGGELQIIAAPTDHWQFGANLGLLDSKLQSVDPTVDNALVGADLPNAPKTTASAYLQYAQPVALGKASIRFDYQFIDKQAIRLITTTAPEDSFFVDSYSTARLQLAIENERWNAALFADNLFDERGQLNRTPPYVLGPFVLPEERYTIIRPRTVGVRVGFNF